MRTVVALVVGSIPNKFLILLDKIQYFFKFTFLFLGSGVEAKRGVDFRRSTRKASRIRNRKRSVLTLGSLCLPYCVRDTA